MFYQGFLERLLLCFVNYCYLLYNFPLTLEQKLKKIMFQNVTQNNSQWEYVPIHYTYLTVALQSVIFITGSIGNTLVILVIWKRKSMQTPTNWYLLSIAVADCIFLISATIPEIVIALVEHGGWPFGRVLCSILIFLQYLSANTSAISITAFTVERYIGICHPMKAQILCTVSRAKRIIFGLWCFSLLYNSPWLGLTTTVSEYDPFYDMEVHSCTHLLNRKAYMIYYTSDFTLFYVVPIVASAVLNYFIIRILLQKNIPKTVRTNRVPSLQATSRSRVQVGLGMLLVVLTFVFNV